MDWTPIMLAATGAAMGGAAGALLGWFGPQIVGMRSRTLTVILAVLLAFAGGRILPEFLPSGTPAMVIDAALVRLEAQPVLQAVAEREPQRAAIWRARLAQAETVSGREGLRHEREALTAEEIARALREYLPRAQDGDLVDFYRATRDLGAALRPNPHDCYVMFFGDQAGSVAAQAARGEAEAAQAALDAALARLIRNAGSETAPFDPDAARHVIEAAAEALSAILRPDQRRMLDGAAPRDAADAAAACDAMLAFLGVYLESDNPPNALRALVAMGS